MTVHIRAVFDGKAFIPDKRVPLAPGTAVNLQVESDPRSPVIDRRTAVDRLMAALNRYNVTPVPSWAMDRDWMYASDDEVRQEIHRRHAAGQP